MQGSVLLTESKVVTSVSTKMLLTVCSYERKEIKGYLYNAFFQKFIKFGSTCDLLFLLDRLMDRLQFPQAAMTYRSFYVGRAYRKAGKDLEREGYTVKDEKELEGSTNARFVVHVQFRQNATWQGTIQWLEGNKTQHFRSALEMLHMMDEALENSKDKPKK